MIRTVIAINDNDKTWLDHMAKEKNISMTAVVREAIHYYRAAKESEPTFEDLLYATKGILKNKKDGLEIQNKLRNEWE